MQTAALDVVRRRRRAASRTVRLDGAAPLAGVRRGRSRRAVCRCRRAVRAGERGRRPKVGPDCHIKVGQALYSVPWRFIGRHVDAREGDRTVEVFVDGTARQDLGPGRTGPADRLRRLPAREGGVLHAHPDLVSPPRRRARAPRSPSSIDELLRAQRAAPTALRAGRHRPRRQARARRGSTPPAGGRSRSATRPIAP